MRPEINYGNYVLLRFDGFVRVPYNVITQEHWEQWSKRNPNRDSWKEVTRGTYAEMEALAKLMPDPKQVSLD